MNVKSILYSTWCSVLGYHGFGLSPLTLHQNSSLSQNIDRVVHNLGLDTLDAISKLNRLQPLPSIRLRVIQMSADVLDSLVLVLVKVLHALVKLLKQVLDSRVELLPFLGQRRRSDNLPAAPGRVDLTDAANLTRVVVALGGEVLPHEEVGSARVDGVAEVLKVVENHRVRERCRGGWGEPAVLVSEDEAHDLAAGADAGDADLATLEGVY